MEETNPRQPHVAVLAFPFGTHAVPLLHLTRRLASAAPDLTFSFFSTTKINASILGSKDIGVADLVNLKSYDVFDGIPDEYVWIGKPQEEIELFVKATPDNFKQVFEMVEKETKKKISCLISDAFLWCVGEMAEEMGGVPWIPFWTAGACSLYAHMYTDLIRQTIGVSYNVREDEAVDFITALSGLRVKDLPPEIIGVNLDSFFTRMLDRMSQILPRATALTLNSFEELDPPIIKDLKSKVQHCLTVGPFNLTSPSPSLSDLDESGGGCLQWLDSQKPTSVVYISFGTVISPPPNELVALAEGIEASGVTFLWSIKDKLKMHFPDGFLDRTSTSGKGMVVPWAPQSRVLQHPNVGVFVTHCGWNSLLESITGGVPMICRPFFGDQLITGGLVSEVWGIGIKASNGVFSRDGVVSALKTMLSKEDGKKMREKIMLLREQAKQAVGSSGSSTKNFNTLLGIVANS